jgi:hypothetical protein
MPLAITKQDIRDRLKAFPRDNYLYIGSIVKGVALALAATVLLQICADFWHEWKRLPPWFASIAAIMVSYTTWGRGVLVTNSRTNLWDSVFPLVMGIAEFLLFGILLLDPAHSWFWSNWFLFMALHTAGAVGLTHNRLLNSKVPQDFTPDKDMQDLGLAMESWIRQDRFGASMITVGCLIAWACVRWITVPFLGLPMALSIQAVLAIPLSAILCKVIYEANKQRQHIDEVASAAQP